MGLGSRIQKLRIDNGLTQEQLAEMLSISRQSVSKWEIRISDSLMKDEHDLVQKGYGWMLKSLSQVDRRSVKDYLILNHAQMPRTAYRYALEKFDKETRKELMNL